MAIITIKNDRQYEKVLLHDVHCHQDPVVQTPISLIHRLNSFNPPTEVG